MHTRENRENNGKIVCTKMMLEKNVCRDVYVCEKMFAEENFSYPPPEI